MIKFFRREMSAEAERQRVEWKQGRKMRTGKMREDSNKENDRDERD